MVCVLTELPSVWPWYGKGTKHFFSAIFGHAVLDLIKLVFGEPATLVESLPICLLQYIQIMWPSECCFQATKTRFIPDIVDLVLIHKFNTDGCLPSSQQFIQFLSTPMLLLRAWRKSYVQRYSSVGCELFCGRWVLTKSFLRMQATRRILGEIAYLNGVPFLTIHSTYIHSFYFWLANFTKRSNFSRLFIFEYKDILLSDYPADYSSATHAFDQTTWIQCLL